MANNKQIKQIKQINDDLECINLELRCFIDNNWEALSFHVREDLLAANSAMREAVIKLNREEESFSRTDKSKNKHFNAACSKCGGWTRTGGMSQYYHTEMGCSCGREAI